MSGSNGKTPPAPRVRCPNCGAKTEFSPANPHRPFCTERCRLIDLGEWFSENRSIPADENRDADNS